MTVCDRWGCVRLGDACRVSEGGRSVHCAVTHRP